MTTNRRGFFGTCAAALAWAIGSKPAIAGDVICTQVAVQPAEGHLWNVWIDYSDYSHVSFTTKRKPNRETLSKIVGNPRSSYICVSE